MVDQLRVNTESYNRICDAWDRVRSEKRIDPCIEELAALLPRGGSILDIGCGTGCPIARYLDGCGFSVTGIDPSEAMIRKAESLHLHRSVFLCTDFFHYQPDGPFDAAVAFDSIFHIGLHQQKHIYPRISELLRPGGLFLFTHGLTTGNVSGNMFGEPFLYSALDEKDLRDCLKESGLEILWFFRHYENGISGDRDLLALVKKTE